MDPSHQRAAVFVQYVLTRLPATVHIKVTTVISVAGLAQLVPLSYVEHEHNILPRIISQHQRMFG